MALSNARLAGTTVTARFAGALFSLLFLIILHNLSTIKSNYLLYGKEKNQNAWDIQKKKKAKNQNAEKKKKAKNQNAENI